MPKYCSVPNCKDGSGTGSGSDRISFYKFPLQDAVRLQQWLKNMGRESWTPSRHQYICHKHFAPSCFKVRWGIRYLDNDAVPTVFQEAEKRKAADHSGEKAKRLRASDDEAIVVSEDMSEAVDALMVENSLHMVHLYEINVNPLQGEAPGGAGTVGQHDCSLQSGTHFPLTLFQTVNDLSNGENAELIILSEGQNELVNGVDAATLTRGHGSVFDCTDEVLTSLCVGRLTGTGEDFSDVQKDNDVQVISYFETMPSVLSNETGTRFSSPPDTVLSSALGSKPISSILPIVSKHVQPSPSSLVLTVERLDTDEGEADDGQSEEDSAERQRYQHEEHCYHKTSLSKEQLEAIVVELQKKVKVLQQRHRRHLEKILSLESTVNQLRQSNLLNEERLQLLERALLQTSAADAGETVAIIYGEDDAAYLYTTEQAVRPNCLDIMFTCSQC
ncbi:LOW QUALITY PROTEIN: THAP domain-containing protein 5-like [Brachionichthys hirsutus]|uniref:LOW QUALITY PROTEIN: THAP domain-containing protein 5-like n=1 Tax=Brachionichthys hirsutus TaxID=412623 RepID=UPI0036052819